MDGQSMVTNYSDGNIGWDKGIKYQQFVIEQYPIRYPGRTLSLMKGKEAQLRGETKEGIEIKYDDNIYVYWPKGRIYIETHEKAREENPFFVKSGINRPDNTTMYLIGDYSIWFIFSKKKLCYLDQLNPPFLYRCNTKSTSKGFCIPVKNAKILCLDFQIFETF